MKTKVVAFVILVACGLLLPSCGKKTSAPAKLAVKVEYSHPEVLTGGHGLSEWIEVGTAGEMVPETGQPISLKGEKSVRFRQRVDASVPGKVLVTIESWMDGLDRETKTLEFGPSPPETHVAEFRNGLKATATVDTHLP